MARIAIDFDGVLFDPRRACMMEGAHRQLNEWSAAGHEITVFTTRPDYDRPSVEALLNQAGLPYHRIVCGKPSYDVFIDDRAKQFTGWGHEHDYGV